FMSRPPRRSTPFPTRRSSDLPVDPCVSLTTRRACGGSGAAQMQPPAVADVDLESLKGPASRSECQMAWETRKKSGEGFHRGGHLDRKSTRLNSSHVKISYAVF